MAVLNMREQAFEKLLESGKPFLVDYWAPWCVYCRRIAPAYKKIAEQYGDRQGRQLLRPLRRPFL